MPTRFALVDCNNFYASCERLFRPELAGRPIVVLSNNDGCVIARSNEAKAFGVAMGAPYFKVRELLARHGVQVFSSNYALYGDLSQRVMATLRQLEPEVEVYSIDEAFLRLPAAPGQDLAEHGRYLGRTVRQHVGIPVAIGIGPTKTLAKIATRIAKKDPCCGGAFDLTDHPRLDEFLAACAVEEVWGIGPQSASTLRARGIRSALDLRQADEAWIRRRLTVTGLRTAMELKGISCLSLAAAPPAKKSLISSKSFGRPVTTLTELREAVATYLAIAAEKLREQGSLAGAIQVFIATNTFNPEQPQHVQGLTLSLPRPSASTLTLQKAAGQCLDRIYRPGFQYKKAGVMLLGLTPDSGQQSLSGPANGERPELMQALDRINGTWGRQAIQLAAAGFVKPWRMAQARKSPAYTTDWQELPVVKAGC